MLEFFINALNYVCHIIHSIANLLLIQKMRKTKSSSGISLKTQIMYCLVFITRYANSLRRFELEFVWIFKLALLFSSIYTVYLMVFIYRDTYQQEFDKVNLPILVAIAYTCAIIIGFHKFSRIIWLGSYFLEALSMLPQFFMSSQQPIIDNFSGNYVAAIAGYRIVYLIYFILLAIVHKSNLHWALYISLTLQSIFNSEFIYYYLKAKMNKKDFALPR